MPNNTLQNLSLVVGNSITVPQFFGKPWRFLNSDYFNIHPQTVATLRERCNFS